MIVIDFVSLVIGLIILFAFVSLLKEISLGGIILMMAGGGIGFAVGNAAGIGWAIFGAIFGVLLGFAAYSNR
jgi:hypothetical protein